MDAYKAHYDAHGYVTIPALVAPDLFTRLVDASAAVTARTRAGDWPHARVVGRQFPPYGAGDDVWGVQHVMHPSLGQPAFAAYYTSEGVRGAARALLGCGENDLQMELFNLLVEPEKSSFALCWHRDDVKPGVGEEEERAALAVSHFGVQWNTALYDDAALFVVPGSHRAVRTPAQRALSSTTDAPADPLSMPGAIRVALAPGDTVFYNSNILHCAAYSPAARRATLHACMGDARGGGARARNVLQHGLKWMEGAEFRRTLNDTGQAMLDRLVELQAAHAGRPVEYSLEG